ncbi:TetR/AcrR family transcriptional regulator [Gryllotalpicola koreensis]|uniref:TetR/AcrR family transcriptional regulator n=1 Tax=Gryllotalpicola koreensis TaxID=993086 RepID=A0ABP7ZT25_9MICO
MSARPTRPGGRSAAVVAAVKAAVEELIEERGRAAITIPMVAERAGVNPTSVYRRWGDLQTMINDIATYRLDPKRPLPDTSDLRRDLELWAEEFVTHYSQPVNAALLRAGAATAGEVESDCLRNRRIEASLLLERAPDSFGLDPDQVIDFVIAPIIYRIIFSPWTVDETTAPRLVGRLFERVPV